MDILNYKIKKENKLKIPNNLKNVLTNKTFCFFDIETTGFHRKRDKVILIGLSLYKENSLIIKQFFANSFDDEEILLKKFKKEIVKYDYILSYNGNRFDIPFLNDRYKYNSLDFIINKSNSIDLYEYIRSNKDILSLDSYKLKNIEKYLDIHREDLISGKKSSSMYKEYIKTKNNTLKDIILKHNYDDVYYLPDILKIFDIVEEKNKVFITTTILNNKLNIKFNLTELDFNGDILKIVAKTSTLSLKDQTYYSGGYNIDFSPKNGKLYLSLEVYNGKLSSGSNCIYFDKCDSSLPLNFTDLTEYNLPENIIILRENNKFIKENLKGLISEIIYNVFN
ncbi:ribonuclease H-like domain-containing protein [Dethiothermospora halolimnae]|uniref:ribonuclease H-like domain-containing protein n=1 Tax=Dethiothermospora halolimnae TaxID=3114390 RepID=UPI003CCBCDEF